MDKKRKHIDRIVAEVRSRAPKEERAPTEILARGLFEMVPVEDLEQRSAGDLAGAARSLLELGWERRPDHPELRVFNPTPEADGWSSKHTAVQAVNDDMPFLVDSLTGELSRRGIEIHLMGHPQLTVARDGDGRLLALEDRSAAREGGRKESFMHLEIDQLTAPKELVRLETDLERVLADVRAAVDDWAAMKRAVAEVVEELETSPPPLPADEIAEAKAFLEWIDDDHYTFLGCREYVVERQDNHYHLRPDHATGLGILRRVSLQTRAATERPLTAAEVGFLRSSSLLKIGKSSRRGTVHRPVHMDVISVKRFDEDGEVVRERRFMGLFTSRAYTITASRIPILRRRVANVVERAGFLKASHDAKALGHILENYPRDELFQISEDDLYRFSLRILQLQLRPRLALLVRCDEAERFVSCMVFVPRDHHNTSVREHLIQILTEAFHGTLASFSTLISDRPLAQLQVIVKTAPGELPNYDTAVIERRLAEAVRSWGDQLKEALGGARLEASALDLWHRYSKAFPASYQERFSAAEALEDVARIEAVYADGPFDLRLYRQPGAVLHRFHCKTFELAVPAPLTEILPRLENMGLSVISEVPFEVWPREAVNPVWVRDFELIAENRLEVDLEKVSDRFRDTFARVWSGAIENDGFNALVLQAELDWRQVIVLRAYCKYLRQTGVAFSQSYMEATLARHPHITRLLMAYFHARLDPALAATAGERAAEIEAEIEERLEAVEHLDEDRILRRFLNLIDATVRTNHFQRTPEDAPKPYLSLKLDAGQVQQLPRPRPDWEIFVYSPRVEAVHLRGGRVARGGIRWSDRREDFRTEVLGLIKAQMVKNAVIVPVGAKGGFVVKRPPAGDDRVALRDEAIECYKTMVRGLLDVTDNLSGDRVIPPPDVVRRDGADSYLVVAADKGTATFSDIANGVAAEYGFWLGDAFASGGSAGYDHKKMGITARGAWESVKLHFRELGHDVQAQDFTVVGVGDMSGDVFGNGMLLSEHIRLVGAFNHRHVFVDPAPDAAASYAERRRLFELPGSGWDHYDPAVLSEGGAVYERDAKSIVVSQQVRELFELPSTEVTPNRLIRAILRARVDLIWFGGIGTYVKASHESHARAGDRANNEIRLDGSELRAKVIGEGANLGVTQAGRIEFALGGGRINTDFIDNSGGVDCSDHEVNIKIALADAVASGDLARDVRVDLLEAMTDAVAALVLRDNYLQSLAITLTESHGSRLLDEEARLMRELERSVKLDRKLEGLPGEDVLAERRDAGQGLTRPEIAVLLAYSKIHVYGELLDSALPDDPQLVGDLMRYFPEPMTKRFRKQIERHRLRREIIATHVTNSMVNRVGPNFVVRMAQEIGSSVSDIARAYTAARDVFGVRAIWEGIEALDNRVPTKLQIEMYLESVRLIESATRWFLRHGQQPLDVSAAVRRFKAPAAAIAASLEEVLSPTVRADLRRRYRRLHREKVPLRLARKVAGLAFLTPACDIASCAESAEVEVKHAGKIYFAIGERFGFYRLRRAAARIEVANPWQRAAITSTIEDLFAHQAELTRQVASSAATKVRQALEVWSEGRRAAVARIDRTLETMSDTKVDLAVLTIGERELRRLAGK